MGKTPIDEYLDAQQRLRTPVAVFADFGDTHDRSVYADLIPLTLPKPGEQYAFEVDLDSCTGCKACVAACHTLNGLDDHETWRETGALVGIDSSVVHAQTITTSCHHCEDPGCMNGCPVLAYEKDPVTGIVRHLDDQCIGCGYCVLKCPYDAPKYNPGRGIVRKCDMCQGRLAHGEAPACAQACPTHAIRIVTVSTSMPVREPQGFLPSTSDPEYTRPTTRYISKRSLSPGMIAGDADRLRVEPAHWPLAIMLTLVGMGVGCATLAAAPVPDSFVRGLCLTGLIAGAVGLAASVAHLGRPLGAWRVFLGVRRSWMSREALLLGIWVALESVAAGSLFGLFPKVYSFENENIRLALAALGLSGLFCSVMIYVDTRRHFWRISQTLPRFFGSALVLGLIVAFVIAQEKAIGLALVAAMLGKLALECRVLRALHWEDSPPCAEQKSARIMTGPLRPLLCLRMLAGFAGGVAAPFAIAFAMPSRRLALAAALVTLAGELAERSLFFRAVVALRMPGVDST